MFYKKLSDLLAVPRKDNYSRTIALVQRMLNFSLLRDAIASLRGAPSAKGRFDRFVASVDVAVVESRRSLTSSSSFSFSVSSVSSSSSFLSLGLLFISFVFFFSYLPPVSLPLPYTLDKDQEVGTVFFDLKKVFDKVWHKGLLIKLEFAGINHRAL